MITRKFIALAATGAALAAAPVGGSLAQMGSMGTSTERTPNFYLGGGAGYYQLEEDDIGGSGLSLDDESFAWKGYAGGTFIPWLGAELSYADFGEVGDGAKIEANGIGAAVLGYLPMGTWAPYLKVGQFWWDADATAGGVTANTDGNDPFYGAGVKLNLSPNLALRVEYERYKFDEVDTDSGWVNAQWAF